MTNANPLERWRPDILAQVNCSLPIVMLGSAFPLGRNTSAAPDDNWGKEVAMKIGNKSPFRAISEDPREIDNTETPLGDAHQG
jgi:hypothetical protein